MHCVWCRGDTFPMIRAPRSYFLRVIMFSPVNKRLRRRELKTCLQREPWGDMELSICNSSWKKTTQRVRSIYADFKEDTNPKQLGALWLIEKPVTFSQTLKVAAGQILDFLKIVFFQRMTTTKTATECYDFRGILPYSLKSKVDPSAGRGGVGLAGLLEATAVRIFPFHGPASVPLAWPACLQGFI